jgi:hypothetical protein
MDKASEEVRLARGMHLFDLLQIGGRRHVGDFVCRIVADGRGVHKPDPV